MYVDRDCKATSVVASAIRGCFVLGTARIKALGCLKKKKKKKNMKKEDDETRFSPLPRFVTLTTFTSNFSAIVVLGQRQRADLTVFGCVQFATR